MLFGGEQSGNTQQDSNKAFILSNTNENSFEVTPSHPLPAGCTPAIALNNQAAFYVISNEGYIFRLNKQELKWSVWQ